MGAKTLYHPVSLNVLRGALEFCGIQPGRLQQLSSDRRGGSARYRLYIKGYPQNAWANGVAGFIDMVQACFSTDVFVLSGTFRYSADTKRETISVELHTSIATGYDPLLVLPEHTNEGYIESPKEM